jgi:hypothetical protein
MNQGVNWVELALFTLILVVVIGASLLFLLFRLEAMAARTRLDLADFQHRFLQDEYTRIASETSLAHEEMRAIVEEITEVARAVQGVCAQRLSQLSHP